jgi:quinolinate synthase
MSEYKSRLERMDKTLRLTPDQHLDFQTQREKIERILQLREEKDVLILGHNYMHPLIYQLSNKRERGDSLALAKYASQADNSIILFDGVLFMAETAKILNPDKKVLIADTEAGCSLADPFKAEDVQDYKRRFPGAPVVTYINSYAGVKAESDYCCTSANGLRVVKHAAKESGNGRVIFLPDSLMGENIQKELLGEGSSIDLIYPGKYDANFGRCEVHEKFTPELIREIRAHHELEKGNPETAVLVHWECSSNVLEEADFYGSTSEMAQYIRDHPELKRVFLGTECEMSANLASEFPNVEFARSCQNFCQHMQKITLEKILYSLENEVFEVNVDEQIAKKALTSIERMLKI